MAALFVALGIAVITLLALLLWFVPHLLHQQAMRSANESARLRNMLLDQPRRTVEMDKKRNRPFRINIRPDK